MTAMTSTDQSADILNFDDAGKKLPDMLNVLTILTFVGCGIGFIGSLVGFFNAQKSYDQIVEARGSLQKAPEFMKSLTGPNVEMLLQKSLENRLPILILSLVALGLCVYGVILMRGQKKAGFSIYVVGEILPIIAGTLFIGLGLYSTFSLVAMFFVPLLFIILYASQLKHLS